MNEVTDEELDGKKVKMVKMLDFITKANGEVSEIRIFQTIDTNSLLKGCIPPYVDPCTSRISNPFL